MRKAIGITLATLGVLAMITGLVLRLWVAPNTVKLPDDTKVTTVAQGEGSGINLATGQAFANVPITATRRLTTAAGNDDVVVWTMRVKLADPTGMALTAYTDRVAVDRDDAKAVNDKEFGEKITDERFGERNVTHEGLTYHFPIDTEKKDYEFFDANTGKAYPASYESEEELDDIKVYKFIQEVPASKIRETQVPGALLGVPAETVTMDVYYTNQRTIWVEPTTGWIVKARENAKTTLRQPGTAQDAAVVLATDLTFNEDTVNKLVDRAEEDKDKIDLVQRILPLTGLIGGLILLALGLFLWFSATKNPRPATVGAGTVDTENEPETPAAEKSPDIETSDEEKPVTDKDKDE